MQNQELVKLDVPIKDLAKLQEGGGQLRAFTRGQKGKTITKNANVTPVDMKNMAEAQLLANNVANIMNVAALVVGQYYMTEINNKLENMSEGINKISDFQGREFKSRIFSLVSRIKKYSGFSSEIIENDESRLRILGVLEITEGDATELLGQVNMEISDICQNNSTPTYEVYQKKTDDLNVLVEYQNVLVSILAEISKLLYLLGKGSTSSEMSFSVYQDYLGQSTGARKILGNWHESQIASLSIDLDKERKAKSGLASLPGLVHEKWKYHLITQDFSQKINSQKQTTLSFPTLSREIYKEDVEIIVRDGKYYYLHSGEEESNLLLS